MKISELIWIFIISLLMFLTLFLLIITNDAEGQKVELGGAGSGWKYNVDANCNFTGNAIINISQNIIDTTLIYTAVIQLGSCTTETEIRTIPNVSTTNQTLIDDIIENDLDAWANERSAISAIPRQKIRIKGSTNSTRGRL